MSKSKALLRFGALLLVALLSLMFAACRTQPLANPAPVVAAASLAETRVAILRALLTNNWQLESERPGEIVTSYSRSDWKMTVEIAYSNEISIRYLRSENLGYEASPADGPIIHKGYNARVNRLAKLIQSEITIARVTVNLPPVAAPPPGEVQAD